MEGVYCENLWLCTTRMDILKGRWEPGGAGSWTTIQLWLFLKPSFAEQELNQSQSGEE